MDEPAQVPTGSKPAGQAVVPKLKAEPQLLGLAGDPGLNRDSGGSVRFGDRVLWTYRDTQRCNPDGSVRMFPIISSTASWSDDSEHGGPDLQPARGDKLASLVLTQYGHNPDAQSFFPAIPHICQPPAGARGDNTRIALWPDVPPLVTDERADGTIHAYTWVKRAHIGLDLSVKTAHPATVLYRTESRRRGGGGARDALPHVSVVDEAFWKAREIGFGAVGNVVTHGTAYLYGREDDVTCLARVRAADVERRAAYEYWVDGGWTARRPRIGQPGIDIPHAGAGGQGTYYFNHHWRCYVWIGGDAFPGAEMYITTAPAPQGPWLAPVLFYTGPRGNHLLGAYSVQAHPGLMCGEERRRKNAIYLTYTKNDEPGPGKGDVAAYTTPLVYVEFE